MGGLDTTIYLQWCLCYQGLYSLDQGSKSFADVPRVCVSRFKYIAESEHLYPSSLCILRFLLLIMCSVLPGVDVSCTYLCSLVSSSFISSSVSGSGEGGDGDCFFSDCVSESVDCLRFPAIFINGIAVVVLDGTCL